jgi:lipopolysaccharide/colanic/teichoic acid biosynthesis glycosyltransferase
MPPGLSGWAQVCAPYAASVEEAELKLSYDLYYLRHWGLALDLLILLKTVKTVLKAHGR